MPHTIPFFLSFLHFLVFPIIDLLFLLGPYLLLFYHFLWLPILVFFLFHWFIFITLHFFNIFFLLSLSFLRLDLSFEDVFIIHAFFAVMSFMSVAGVLVEYVSIVFLIVHVNRNIQIYYIKYNIIYLFNLLISYAFIRLLFFSS